MLGGTANSRKSNPFRDRRPIRFSGSGPPGFDHSPNHMFRSGPTTLPLKLCAVVENGYSMTSPEGNTCPSVDGGSGPSGSGENPLDTNQIDPSVSAARLAGFCRKGPRIGNSPIVAVVATGGAAKRTSQ